MKNQVDPSIHQLLAYDVNIKNVDVALGTTDILSDSENLTVRSQCRVVSVDVQKAILTAEETKMRQGNPMMTTEGSTAPKDLNLDSDTLSSGEKRPLHTWDANQPMTAESIAAMNAAKKLRGGPKGRLDAYFTMKPNVASQSTKVTGVKRDATECDKKGSLYYTKHKIKFKFEQGFSMAVKRPVSINEFF